MSEYYVYTLSDSSTGRIFYVGKGKNNRIFHHEKTVNRGRKPNNNPHLYYTIKNLLDADIKITYDKPYTNLNENIALDYEEELILSIGIDNLCNIVTRGRMTDYSNPTKKGGFKKGYIPWNKGKTGVYSDKTKQQISKTLSGITLEDRYGKSEADKIKAKLSKIHKGSIVSQKTRDKIRKSQTGVSLEERCGIEKSDNIKRSVGNRSRNTKWVTDGLHSKQIKLELLDKFLSENPTWKLGHTHKIAMNVICPHCKNSGNPGAMAHWHFDNCKFRKI